jgi:hypothetical protein
VQSFRQRDEARLPIRTSGIPRGGPVTPPAPTVDPDHYRELREAADALLRTAGQVLDFDHPALAEYRRVRAQAPDFGSDQS